MILGLSILKKYMTIQFLVNHFFLALVPGFAPDNDSKVLLEGVRYFEKIITFNFIFSEFIKGK